MRELIMPPPPSGLPFNAQPNAKARSIKLPEILGREKELARVICVPLDDSEKCTDGFIAF